MPTTLYIYSGIILGKITIDQYEGEKGICTRPHCSCASPSKNGEEGRYKNFRNVYIGKDG